MKRLVLLLLAVFLATFLYGQSRVPAQVRTGSSPIAAEPKPARKPSTPIGIFASLFIPVSSFPGEDFSGDMIFSDGSFTLAVPSMPLGIGWGASIGFEFPLGAGGAFFMREAFVVQQTFHAGEFQGEPMRASNLLFSLDVGVGYRVLRFASAYASVGWAIPYWIFVEDGYAEGAVTENLSYFGIEGLEALAGAEFRVSDRIAIFAEAVYRLLDFGDASFADRSLVPLEYFGSSGWNFRAGLKMTMPLE